MCRVQIKYIRYGRDDRINQIRETGNIKYIETQTGLFGRESDLAQDPEGFLYLCSRRETLSLI